MKLLLILLSLSCTYIWDSVFDIFPQFFLIGIDRKIGKN